MESEAETEDEIKEGSEEEERFQQPGLVTGGTLKDYQLEGVAWMASLWENGISGILGKLNLCATEYVLMLMYLLPADEMGLGKVFSMFLKCATSRNNGHILDSPNHSVLCFPPRTIKHAIPCRLPSERST